MEYPSESPLPRLSRLIKTKQNENAVAKEDLPSIRLLDNGICTCPYCSEQFVVQNSNSEPNKQTENEERLTCTRCNYSWKKRKNKPKKCPQCGSYQWDTPSNTFECGRCHYSWISTLPGGPIKCPSCRSSNWRETPVKKKISFAEDPFENTLKRWICQKYDSDMGCVDIACDLKLPIIKVVNLVKEYYSLTSLPRF